MALAGLGAPCAAMHLEDVLDDPAIVSVVEARRVLSVDGLIPGVSGGRDVVEPVTGWGELDDDWEGSAAEGTSSIRSVSTCRRRA